jgi:DNA ligase-1
MKQFTELFLELDRTTRTSEKLEALRGYFRTAPPADAVWAVYLLTGRKIGRAVSFRLLRNWAAEIAGYPAWLFDECYHLVGDLSETLSLILPIDTENVRPPTLHEIIEETLKPLAMLAQDQQRKQIIAIWQKLTPEQRLVFHKLLSREFRVGVSRNLLIRALADVAGVDPQIMAHRLAGNWSPTLETMQRLMAGPDHESSAQRDPTLPYPFMLAHPLGDPLESLGAIDDWFIEWKWDGIRAQLIRRQGKAALWSRGDEIVTGAFPEIIQAASAIPDGTVIDGEIVAWDETNQRPMTFAKLQRRINRKNVELSFWPDVPVAFIAFDLLELGDRDMRGEELHARRAQLEQLIEAANHPQILRLSTPVVAMSWNDLEQLLAESRDRAVEGFMLKKRGAPYQAGRPTGLWWKLKIQPFTVDAVLIAAQSGHGRRAGLLTDYTFGVWDESGSELVPVAKAYSGLTDEEILHVDRWVRRNTLERHGPVHAVTPELVFELGFEAIQRSDRHKSGIAVRFPRMLRMRTDKKPKDADTLQTLRALLAESEARA